MAALNAKSYSKLPARALVLCITLAASGMWTGPLEGVEGPAVFTEGEEGLTAATEDEEDFRTLRSNIFGENEKVFACFYFFTFLALSACM